MKLPQLKYMLVWVLTMKCIFAIPIGTMGDPENALLEAKEGAKGIDPSLLADIHRQYPSHIWNFKVIDKDGNDMQANDAPPFSALREPYTIIPSIKSLALATRGKMAALWDPITRECVQTFEGHRGTVDVAEFSPNYVRDLKIVSLSFVENVAKLWSAKTGECLNTFTHQRIDLALFYGDQIVTISQSFWMLWRADGTIINKQPFQPTGRFEDISADGSTILVRLEDSDDDNRKYCIWDVSSAEKSEVNIKANEDTPLRRARISANGSKIFGFYSDDTVRVWIIDSGECAMTIPESDNPYFFKEHPDGSQFINVYNGYVELWSISSSELMQKIQVQRSACLRDSVANFDSDELFVSDIWGHATKWNWSTNEVETFELLPQHRRDYWNVMRFSPNFTY